MQPDDPETIIGEGGRTRRRVVRLQATTGHTDLLRSALRATAPPIIATLSRRQRPIPTSSNRLLRQELGYLHLDRRGAELLFQVLTEREERSAIAIASNEPLSSWTKTFTDPRLCAAIVDRLTFARQIIETGGTSYRLAHARTIKAAAQSPTHRDRQT
jgi:hypothetical protein